MSLNLNDFTEWYNPDYDGQKCYLWKPWKRLFFLWQYRYIMTILCLPIKLRITADDRSRVERILIFCNRRKTGYCINEEFGEQCKQVLFLYFITAYKVYFIAYLVKHIYLQLFFMKYLSSFNFSEEQTHVFLTSF